MITAYLKNHRIAPRKVRLVADMIRGKRVEQAQTILTHALKKAKHPIAVLLDSAVANAKHNFKLSGDDLYIKEICVDPGQVLKRHRPVSRGSAHAFKRRTSHIRLVLAPRAQSKSAKVAKPVKSAQSIKAAKPVAKK